METCQRGAKTPAVANVSEVVELSHNELGPVLQAVVEAGPVVVLVDASKWHSYAEGIYDGCDEANLVINHAV